MNYILYISKYILNTKYYNLFFVLYYEKVWNVSYEVRSQTQVFRPQILFIQFIYTSMYR